jgi:cytochrome P450
MSTSTIPGPAGLSPLGSLLDFRHDSIDLLTRSQREYGDLVRFTLGPPGLRRELYAAFSPEGAQQVLAADSAHFRKDSRFYQEARATIGSGLLTSQDELYQRQRRLLQPLFTPRRVEGYGADIAEEALALAARWRDAAGGTVNLFNEMSRLTQRVTVRILFGPDTEAALDVVSRCFPVMSGYIQARTFALATLPRGWPTPANRKAAAAADELYAVCDQVIRQRHARLDPEAGDMISLLVNARSAEDGRLDPAEVRDQALVFLLAGTETTSTSLAMALHLLALHPQLQQRAREEAREVLGDRAPDSADLAKLPYLTWVIKEAMRLYPAGAFITRSVVEDTVIDGHLIPAGSEALVSPWVTQRHPDHWEHPDRFDPDRWAPELEKARHRYTWFPFGGGPRACIGRSLAMLEAVLALAVILRDIELAAVDREVRVKVGVTLQPQHPVRCRLSRAA